MRLSIYSLEGLEYDAEAKGINIKTMAGEVTILDHHLPLISVLEKCKARIFEPKAIKEIDIRGGFLEMGEKNNLTLLID